ncbi:class I SAM-dependent methyltransferase [Pseudofrankia inefficax]|uniref:Methyltransferase type 11 n=1 Tax=Pseudofrankia inefficax (strain DSM 45817 / CECT 9037 / DDB 130130 / EuI1c) TaxID=298654 RepID=E3J7N5_PSEI1|nr:methyltransferase domain-containing protein [Pseudofrankia inefficax]ADP79644.1 Methyltransferase type 11 [Pseudofrankia inefficax]
MALIAYDDAAATAFRASRHVPAEGLAGWKDAVGRHLAPRRGMRVLDVGAGTGAWSAAFTDWAGLDMVALEPAAAMRARTLAPRMVGGEAAALPFGTGSFEGAWLSTVIHHVADLPAAAAELRRVLRAGAPVLIRSVFRERPEGVTLFRYFPEAVRALDQYPSVAELRAVFASAGFRFRTLEAVPQVTAGSVRTALSQLRRDAHTPLRLITDAEYDAGVRRMRAAAEQDGGQVTDTLDLLVFS